VLQRLLRKTGYEAKAITSDGLFANFLSLGPIPDIARALFLDVTDRRKMNANLDAPVGSNEEITHSYPARHDFFRSLLFAKVVREQTQNRSRRQDRRTSFLHFD